MLTANPLEIDHQAEIALFGAAILGGQPAAQLAISLVKPSDLCEIRVAAAWIALQALVDTGKPINPSTLSHYIRNKGLDTDIGDIPSFISEAIEAGISVELHAQDVSDNSRRRHLAHASTVIAYHCKNRAIPIDEIQATADSLLTKSSPPQSAVISVNSVLKSMTNDIEKRCQSPNTIHGIPSGFHKFDNLTDGLQPGCLSIIAARPSVGKSAIAGNIIAHACLTLHIPTLVISLEMSPEAILKRIASSICNIPNDQFRNGTLSEQDIKKLTLFNAKTAKAPIQFTAPSSNPDCRSITNTIKRSVRDHGTKLVVIDYLQRISGSGKFEKKTYEVGSISSAIKATAHLTNTAILSLAQLNREPEKNKSSDSKRSPKLSDLADSSQIERDGDLIAILSRDLSQNDQTAELAILKQREGSLGLIDLLYDKYTCKFSEITQDHESNWQDRKDLT